MVRYHFDGLYRQVRRASLRALRGEVLIRKGCVDMRKTESAKNIVDYLSAGDDVLLGMCEIDCYRASGPGGQKRNKTSSAVRIRHRPTGLMAIANEDRSQHVNRRRALRRLRLTLALQVRREMVIEDYEPSAVLRSCTTSRSGLSVGRRDLRYCVVVQEILDVLAAAVLHIRPTASAIGITTAQLSKFLRGDQKLLARVNELRKAAGMNALRST